MFDKFGEFDSAEEINRAAAAQLKEGDLDAVKTIAEENGLDPEDAEDSNVLMNYEPNEEEALNMIIPKYVTSLFYGALVGGVCGDVCEGGWSYAADRPDV